jgi:hypothetical protein
MEELRNSNISPTTNYSTNSGFRCFPQFRHTNVGMTALNKLQAANFLFHIITNHSLQQITKAVEKCR